MLNIFGVARAFLALFSVGVAHNFAFLLPLPREFWPLIDATFLSSITVQYLLFLSGVLVLSVFTAQVLGVIRGFHLALWVNHLTKKNAPRLYPYSKRERYLDRVTRKVEGGVAPIAQAITWCLPIAVIGYFYAGWLALISLPILMILFSISVPILYPALNFNIEFVDDEGEKQSNQNAKFWLGFFSDSSNQKQLVSFVMSAAILMSCYLGLTRHNYLIKNALLEFNYLEKNSQYSLIGTNAQGYVVFDARSNAYLLVSYGNINILTSAH